jgi:DNA-directed RNA polymerase subunit M/transcription elongation factor TFIIS
MSQPQEPFCPHCQALLVRSRRRWWEKLLGWKAAWRCEACGKRIKRRNDRVVS